MKENVILVCAVVVSVCFIGLPFIYQAARSRRNAKRSRCAVKNETGDPGVEPPYAARQDDEFLARFIALRQEPFSSAKTVRIRPSYYRCIKEVISEIGNDEISIISYVDNVLKAHFDDNYETINTLYSKHHRSGNIR